MAEPIVRTVKRYICPFCHRGRSKASYSQQHIDQCWKNPESRSCGSCLHYSTPCCYEANADCGCNGQATCDAGSDMRAGCYEGSEYRIVRDCPSWAGEHPEPPDAYENYVDEIISAGRQVDEQ